MNKSTATLFKKVIASSVLFAGTAMMVLSTPIAVFADRFDEQIRALESEVGQFQAEAGRLRAEADTLQNKVNAINVQKQAIQAQIDLNQAKHDQLVIQIDETQKKIDKQKEILGTTLANLYVDSEVSGLEMVASSTSIGDYMDKQEYRSAIRDKLNGSIKKIRELRQQLNDQKVAVESLLKEQEEQRTQLAAQEAEQARLLEQTRGEEAAYQDLMSQHRSAISSLRSQQIAANQAALRGSAVAGDPSRGGYPSAWANSPQDSMADDWGMYNRQCVSYTAWKVYQAGKYMPKNWVGWIGPNSYDYKGNAKYWPRNAQEAGIPTGYTPRAQSVAVSTAGNYGHVMWVEEVYGNGTIRVSQYNYGWDGQYSEMVISSSGLTYIYF